MKFIADENIYKPIIDYLREKKHNVLSVVESGHSGSSDDEVYKLACRQKRIIITMDKDFSRIFDFSPQNCGGIIIVKIYKRKIDETLRIFKKYFEKLKEKDIKKNLVIISPESLRIRKNVLR